MQAGKIASQAGHAYCGSLLPYLETPTGKLYAAETPGTKVCLQGNLDDVHRVMRFCAENQIPHFLVVDSGCPNFFDGQPTITAVGFGPAKDHEVSKLTRRFKLL
jgi:peptidyl-tRNA hydrolase